MNPSRTSHSLGNMGRTTRLWNGNLSDSSDFKGYLFMIPWYHEVIRKVRRISFIWHCQYLCLWMSWSCLRLRNGSPYQAASSCSPTDQPVRLTEPLSKLQFLPEAHSVYIQYSYFFNFPWLRVIIEQDWSKQWGEIQRKRKASGREGDDRQFNGRERSVE